jgi:ABC-type cobalamin/Fe3+-siderophores transport system ATPase subunit
VVFATEEGEFFGLLGADGTGKATLSSVLAGLTRASAGNDGGSDEACVLRPLQAAACTYRIAFGPRAGQKALTVQGVIPREKDY